MNRLRLTLEIDRETDGRWIADIPELPGVLVYGATKQEAARKVLALALEVLSEMVEEGELTLPETEKVLDLPLVR